MDLGRSRARLPPDHVVEEIDAILDATAAAIDRHHDPTPDSMLRVGVAPCSPFSVTGELLEQAAQLARDKGVRLHTHLAETDDEESFCRERFGCSPVEYVESLGWLGPDVWLAHGVHLDDGAVAALAASGPGWPTARRPTPASAPASAAPATCGTPVSRSVWASTGPRLNEAASLVEEPAALGALRAGRRRAAGPDRPRRPGAGHARRRPRAGLGRPDRLARARQAGRPRPVALDTAAHVNIPDPVAALVLGLPPPLELLLVQGRPVVRRDALVTVDEERLAVEVHDATDTLLTRAVGR